MQAPHEHDPVSIPAHLPRRLAICYYGWDWITSALPDEAYGDLERAVRETKERGFNCIRPDVGLGLLFDADGNRRGPLEFTEWIPGCSDNIQCVNCRGGGTHDVWERVMQLFELAEQYDIYIIGTSWLYQDFNAQIADVRIREELMAVPYEDRLMLLAKQWDWLLKDLKHHNLSHRLALVELVNELDSTPIFAPVHQTLEPPTIEDWYHGRFPESDSNRLRDLAAEALALLREDHPELLITVDLGSAESMARLLPDNAQVADHHCYPDALPRAIADAVGARLFDRTSVPDPESNELLRSLLKPNPMPWEELKRRATRVRSSWHPIVWFYDNVDNAKYDAWCIEHFDEMQPRIEQTTEKHFRTGVEFAKQRGLPLVVDEGYICYPPLHSRLIEMPEGRFGEELAVNTAIAAGYWGILPTGYVRPNTPGWYHDDQCDWVRGINQRILAG